ncbi:MAG: 4-hydroxy-3-methylbut-2-enyl diphosphate reductase [Bacteroidia bacterium]|nr:4-hydroxy-3-methylbut-2-enyl diphosphate reductase [Bacteroidia bacterium]
MPNLQVHIDPGSGFCFGVVYAIEMAEEILRQEDSLYCLGDIVHNDMEVERLERMGLKIIDHDTFKNIYDAKVLIRAHGEAPETYKIALQNRLQLIDASCPVILKLQNRIRTSYEKKEHILIYGKARHAEVIGLAGQTGNDATVFQDISELDFRKLPRRVTLYSQSTKSKRSFYRVLQELRAAGLEVKAHDTICRQVSHRDLELESFAKAHELIIFVSGKKSSNGRMLYKVCREHNPNSYFVSSREELQREWFRGMRNVGICGATSTPQWLMEAIKEKIESYSSITEQARLKVI